MQGIEKIEKVFTSPALFSIVAVKKQTIRKGKYLHKATQVEVEGEPLENFSVTTFSFDMVKK